MPTATINIHIDANCPAPEPEKEPTPTPTPPVEPTESRIAPLFAPKSNKLLSTPKRTLPDSSNNNLFTPTKRTVDALPPIMSHKRTKKDITFESMPLAAKGKKNLYHRQK